MNIEFFIFAGDPRTAQKPVPANKIVKQCKIQGAANVLSPTFTLNYSADIIACNYFYVPTWQRIYKMSNPVVDEGGRMYISGSIDAVASWYDQIKQCSVNVIRSQNAGINYVADDMLPINPAYDSIQSKLIPNSDLRPTGPRTGRCYVFTLK